MAESRTLQILITAQNEAKKELSGLTKQLDDLEPTFRKMRNAGAIAFGAITAEVGFAVKASAEAETQMVKVNAILNTLPQTTIKAAGGMSNLKKTIEEVSKANIQLAFDDEDTAVSLSRLTQATGDVNKAMDLNATAMDLARFKGVDLETATSALIKMYAGNAKELKNLGFAVEDTMTSTEMFGIVSERVAGQAEGFAKSTEGSMEIMKISAGNLQEAIGDSLKPAFDKLREAILPIITKFGEWVEKNPELASTILLVAGALSGLAIALGILGMTMTILTPIATALGISMGALFVWILVIVVAIGLLIAVGLWLYKHWDEIKEKAIEVWNAIKEWIVNTITSVKDWIISTWNSISEFFIMIWEWIKLIFNMALAFIIELWNRIWQGISDFVRNIWEGIKNTINAGWAWIKNIFTTSTQVVIQAWQSVWDGVKTALVSTWEFIKNTIKSGINWVLEKINTVIRAANKLAQTGAGALGLNIPQIPEIPMLAKGGIVKSPTLAMVGEAGPEAVVPLNKANGMGGIILNITGNTIAGVDGVNQLVEMISDALMSKLALNQRI